MLEYYYNDRICLLSSVTFLLVVIIAVFISNVLKERSQDNDTKQEVFEQYSKNEEHAEYVEKSSCDENSRDGGLLARLKAARLKTLEAQLTNDQLDEERRVEREQLLAIFELLKKQESKLNVKEIDESELNAQLSLYR